MLESLPLLRMLFVPFAGGRESPASRQSVDSNCMVDATKRIERAEKALQKGKPDHALDEYLAILEEDPSNEAVYHTAADVSVSLGRNSEAVRLLTELFDRQCARSDKPKASLTYKKLSRVARPTGEQSLTFAHSLAKTNAEALKAYESALQVFTAKARNREALTALNGIVALSPSIENFRKQGELAAALDLNAEAASAYLAAGELEKDDDSKFVLLERAYKLNPEELRIALAYGEALLARGSAEKAGIVVEPFAAQGEAQTEARSLYGRAMLVAHQPARAIGFLWEMLQQDASHIDKFTQAIGALLAADQSSVALQWIRKLETRELKASRRREFITLVTSVAAKCTPGVEFLEYMAGVFDSANREHEYCDTLIKLFDLHYASGNYAKAAVCLDRAAEVDAYEPGHISRLEMLRGKVDFQQLTPVASRLGVNIPATGQASQTAAPEPESESTPLDDLITQAEIYFRYSMDVKAVEKLKRIQRLFPGEENKNVELHELYGRAGLLAPRAPEQPKRPEPIVEQLAREQERAESTSVGDIGRVTEITTNLYRQATVKNVLFACVNDAGRHWNASRCLAVLCTPGKPPSIALEYCAPGMTESDIHSIVKIVGLLQPLAVAHGTLNLSSAKDTKPVLRSLRKPLAAMGIESLLGTPLINGDDHVGLLALAQCDGPRKWSLEDASVLSAIAEQVVLAVGNARLRKLIRDLAVTDEKSGLVKRSSYMDVVLSEIARGLSHNSPTSVMLMNFGDSSEIVRHAGTDALEFLMRHIASLITSHVRQNDIAIRYDETSIALVLADTSEKNAMLAAEKLRKVAAVTTVPGRDAPPQITVGIAEAVLQPTYDPADITTEVVNRVQHALSQAIALGGNQTRLLPVPMDYTTALA